MKYVLDSSVGAQCLLVETNTPKARELRDRFNNGDVELMAPDVYPIEVLNVITKAERKKRITPEEGALLAVDCMNSLPILVPSLPLLARAYELSSKTRSAVYDVLYLALAEREACEMVTADEKLVNNLPGYPIIHISTL